MNSRTPSVSYVLMDRDDKFSEAFRSLLKQAGAQPLRLPPRSPNLNAHLERFFRSIKGETLERLIFFSEDALRTSIVQFLAHYHVERNHQGLDHQILQPGEEVGQAAGPIDCRQRLGGLLKYYYRRAA